MSPHESPDAKAPPIPIPPVVDSHNDLLMLVRHFERDSDYFARHWLPQLVAGGVRVQVLPIYVDDSLSPDAALHETLRVLEVAHEMARRNQDTILICLTPADIQRAIDSNRIALVLALEGCGSVGRDVDLLRTHFRLGVRVASHVHLSRNDLADGSAEEDTRGGLTTAGVEALRLMESIGILVDVSHLSLGGLRHVLAIATRPLIASHSGARALAEYHRNIPDAELRAIGDTGGVIGVPAVGPMLGKTAADVADVLDHIEYVVSVAGIDHVGVGADFFRDVETVLYPDPRMPWSGVVQGLSGPADFPVLWHGLLERGFSEGDASALVGGNFLRVLKSVIGIPSLPQSTSSLG